MILPMFQSTLDDYESVPVQEFGLAMLRGMGWTKTNEKWVCKLFLLVMLQKGI